MLRTLACVTFGLVIGSAVARAQPRSGAASAPDGYEDCTHGGRIALSVELSDAATGRGIPWRVVPLVEVAWRAGRSAGTGRDMPNFGPGGDYPTQGTADRLQIGVVWGRPGTYRLRVRAPGYRVWDTAGVRVPEGVDPRVSPLPSAAPHCGTGPEVVVPARLQPIDRRRP
jgi:hypothetical protein